MLIETEKEILDVREEGEQVVVTSTKKEVPIWEKALLTVEEATAYTGIGGNRLRSLSDERNCDFVLWAGRKRLLKRKKLEEFLSARYSV